MTKPRSGKPHPRTRGIPKHPGRANLGTRLKPARASLDAKDTQLEFDALRQARRESESSREQYADLYDLAPFAHLTLDRNGIIRNLNLTAANLLGRRRDHLLGRPFLPLVFRRDHPRFLSHLRELRRGKDHATVELELQPANAPRVAVQMETVAHAGDKSRIQYRTALFDITERKRAVARTTALAKLGLLLSAAADPAAAAQAVVDTAQEYCGWDACFLLLYAAGSDYLTQLVNVDTINGRRVPVAPMLQGRPPTPLIRQVLEEGPQLILRQSPEEAGPTTTRFGDTSRPSLSLMFVPLRQEGHTIGVLSVQSYQRNAYTREDLTVLQGLADHTGGALARLQAQAALRRLTVELEARVVERTAQLEKYQGRLEELVKQRTRELEAANQGLRKEIGARKSAEESLVHLTEELKRSNMELEQFAYVASHDLQEPLRAVGGYVRLLELRFPDLVDEKAREYIKGAAEGATRMEQQLSDLLALSRVGTQGGVPAPVNLAAPLDTAMKNLQFSILSNNATVTADPLPTLPVDESQFVQLFQNLIGNAIKFHGESPPQVHIGACAKDGQWIISVRDNGIGIAPQYSKRIFQVFQRLHTRKKYSGTGIGLAICQKIVQRHGGRIWVESQLGLGATFLFAIPDGSVIVHETLGSTKG
jgi:PAS domain S-box-containing protein